jgi:hypothetical protein
MGGNIRPSRMTGRDLAILAWLLSAANIFLIPGMSACWTPQAGSSWRSEGS